MGAVAAAVAAAAGEVLAFATTTPPCLEAVEVDGLVLPLAAGLFGVVCAWTLKAKPANAAALMSWMLMVLKDVVVMVVSVLSLKESGNAAWHIALFKLPGGVCTL